MAGSNRSGPMPRLVPRLALCGEFSAGKSSIVNLLVASDMLPTSVLSSTRRPTYLRYAPSLRIEAVSESGERETVSPKTISRLVREDISHFEVGMPSELLHHFELLDTPGFADPFQDHQRTLDAIEGADICLWCTLATQAWRESERQTWLSLPARFRTGGILVATHADTLAHSGEQQRVRTRLSREAGGLFGDIVLLSVLDAMRAVQDGNAMADAGLWRDSGGSALVAALEKTVSSYHAEHGNSPGGTAEAPWIGLELGIRFGLGFRLAQSAVAMDAPPQLVAPQAAPAPEPPPEATAEAEAEPAAPAAATESERFLTMIMETVPSCLAAAWIDLAARQLLLFRESEPGNTAASAMLGEAITDLFHGANAKRIEGAFGPSRSQPEEEGLYFQEIFIMTDDCIGVFVRSSSRIDRALAVVSDNTVNLGMVVSRARTLMAAAASLP